MLKHSRARNVLDWVVTIAGAVAIVLALKAWVVNPYRIPSSSMAPTLACGRTVTDAGCKARFSDRVLADRLIYRLRDPRRAEIVVFRAPDKARRLCSDAEGSIFVKRVVGLPGEKVTERDGWILVDGKRLAERYLPRGTRRADAGDAFRGPVTVPARSYFMLGDNRSGSCDSRTWGAVPRKSVIGEVFVTYWPPSRLATY